MASCSDVVAPFPRGPLTWLRVYMGGWVCVGSAVFPRGQGAGRHAEHSLLLRTIAARTLLPPGDNCVVYRGTELCKSRCRDFSTFRYHSVYIEEVNMVVIEPSHLEMYLTRFECDCHSRITVCLYNSCRCNASEFSNDSTRGGSECGGVSPW